MESDFGLFRRNAELPSAATLFAPWAGRERWLFVSPHDDDALIGAGLWIQALLASAATVTVAIVTNGRMGYTDATDRDNIVARRRREAEAAYRSLGVTAIRHLGFPDGSLNQHGGSRLEEGRPAGLDCALTQLLRELKPNRVVTSDAADWHPDHRATFESTRMSLFHSCGKIWPELGESLPAMPALYTFAVYAPFEGEPDFLIEASDTAANRKLDALREFASQATIIEQVAASAKQEYLRDIQTSPYDPGAYRRLFPA